MLVALNQSTQQLNIPEIAEVTSVPVKPSMLSLIHIHYFKQERASHKPRWCRYFHKTVHSYGTATYKDILLYDFTLTKMGALRKSTRECLQKQFD